MAVGVNTICALSSGRLPAAIAVVRLSGPHALEVARVMGGPLPEPGRLVRRSIRRRNGDLIDRALVVVFKGPHSETGEDIAEFQLHGGRAVVAAVVAEACAFAGVRLAEAGEFSRRAFVNGKMDLAALEGLADLVDAETEMQRRLALDNADGRQGRLYESWRARLRDARAMVEASIDFVEEEDVSDDLVAEARPGLSEVADEIGRHLAGFHIGEMIRDGFRVVLLGAPNAGKSALLNALARRDAAIVSDEPGTTRDLIDVSLDLNGHKVIVTDTAGLRSDPGRIEAMGIERSRARAAGADVVLWLSDCGDEAGMPAGAIRVLTKMDLRKAPAPAGWLGISASTGYGLDALIGQLVERVERSVSIGEALPTRLRHKEALQQCLSEVAAADINSDNADKMAEHLRAATDALGRITGAVGVEELLDSIFGRFCIGK